MGAKKTYRKYKYAAKAMLKAKYFYDTDVEVKIFNEGELEKFRIAGLDGRAIYVESKKFVTTANQIEMPKARKPKMNVLKSQLRVRKPVPSLDKWMYVMDACGNIYVARGVKTLFHHSSLARGEAPVAAGTIEAEDGMVKYLDEESGHYGFNNHLHLVTYEMHLQGILVPSSANLVPSPHQPVPPDQRLGYELQEPGSEETKINIDPKDIFL